MNTQQEGGHCKPGSGLSSESDHAGAVFSDASLQNCRKTNIYRLGHPVHGILCWRPELTETEGRESIEPSSAVSHPCPCPLTVHSHFFLCCAPTPGTLKTGPGVGTSSPRCVYLHSISLLPAGPPASPFSAAAQMFPAKLDCSGREPWVTLWPPLNSIDCMSHAPSQLSSDIHSLTNAKASDGLGLKLKSAPSTLAGSKPAPSLND